MNYTTTLVLCQRCGDGVELNDRETHELQDWNQRLGGRVVVHCRPCFIIVSRLS